MFKVTSSGVSTCGVVQSVNNHGRWMMMMMMMMMMMPLGDEGIGLGETHTYGEILYPQNERRFYGHPK